MNPIAQTREVGIMSSEVCEDGFSERYRLADCSSDLGMCFFFGLECVEDDVRGALMEVRSARGTQMLDLHRIIVTILSLVSSEVSLRLAVRTSLTSQAFWALDVCSDFMSGMTPCIFCLYLFYRIESASSSQANAVALSPLSPLSLVMSGRVRSTR